MAKASSPCPQPGCPNLKPCPDHKPTPWAGSTRRATLPADWNQRVATVHRRAAGRCEHVDGQRCPLAGAQVDHAVHRDDHRIEALQLLCDPHHRTKTQAEAAAGRWPKGGPGTPSPPLRRGPGGGAARCADGSRTFAPGVIFLSPEGR